MQQSFASIGPVPPAHAPDPLQLPVQAQHDPLSLFSRPVDPATMHIPLSDTVSPPSAGIPPMDPLNPPKAAPPGLLPDFPPAIPFASLDTHLPTHPSATTSPPSGPQPVLGISSAFSVSSTSAVPASSTAMIVTTSPAASLSAAGSSSPSSTLFSSSSDISFSSLSSIAPPVTQEPAFAFPLRGTNDSCLSVRDTSPDANSDANLMVVGDMLKTIAQTAQSASNACSLGQGFEAEARIDELKKTINMVSELIAATQISDPPTMSQASSPRRYSGYSAVGSKCSISPPARNPVVSGPQDVGQPVMQFSSLAGGQESGALDALSNGDGSDLSRKRCASSMAGDRVQKALKREPQEDTSVHSFIPTTTVGSSWSEGVTTVPQRNHQHTVSGSSFSNAANFQSIPSTSAALGPIIFSSTASFSTSPTQARPLAAASGISPPAGRVSRSGSFTNNYGNNFTFALPEVPPASGALDFLQSSALPPVAPAQGAHSPASSQEGENGDESDIADPASVQSPSPELPNGTSVWTTTQGQAPRQNGRPGTLANRSSTENVPPPISHGNEVPQEYRAEVDRIFFEFLNSICSNLEATDAKGEPIHQTLMAKKMQRLDESPDFRPFKFRIQAFTNAFLEELAKQGYPEEKIPMKKIRNYLWSQPYISRFNEEGKKTKSKGNHIWNIDAKKNQDGGWTFRPFYRRLAGSPPSVAYVGLRWSWAPRIWDPQASRTNLHVTYTSPSLPSWLSWEGDVLQGIPTPDAESCDITVEAHFVQDGVEERLTQTFHLNVAPVSTLDASFAGSRRGSLNGDVHKPKGISIDGTTPSITPPRSLRAQGPVLVPSAPPVTTHDAQVMQVLATAAQRVAQEAQSQVIASTNSVNDHGPELQALAKQRHVLTVTAQAFDQEVTGQRADVPAQVPNVLAAAAQQVVLQAARQVAADRSAAAVSQISAGLPPPLGAVTVNEVSVATQSAVAQAVEITGPLSSEVDVLITASSLLQQQTRAPVNPPVPVLDPSQRAPPMDTTTLPQSTSSLTTGSFALGLVTPANTNIIPTIPLADFGRLS
ncbi:hypothetical protein EV401DRAFT_1862452 [Pisolithus croceorrhizus]|nr:hypothetical protein EV401DRAFT_1862452 [Pisolithus croceorrhizus]